jgi:hypothetical protein
MRCQSIRSRNSRLAATLLAALLVGSAGPAPRAAESEDARLARELYRNGEEAFRAGRFEEAYQQWQQGYKLSSRPLFLLNMAHAQRRRGELNSARALYRRFLLVEPQSKLRAEVESVLEEIDLALAAEPGGVQRSDQAPATEPPPATAPPAATTPPPATPAVTAPPIAPLPIAAPPLARPAALAPPALVDSAPPLSAPPDRPIYTRWWFWTGTGALLAAGVAGFFLLRADPYTKSGSIGTLGAPRP